LKHKGRLKLGVTGDESPVGYPWVMANRNKARKEWDNTMQEMAANAGKELKLGGKSKAGKRVTRKCRPLPNHTIR
jgi:hypothetical protein